MNPLGLFSPRLRYVLIVALLFPVLFSCDDDEETPMAEVMAVNPASALPNTLVSITGKFFSPTFSENKVTFNGKEALVSNASSTQLNVVVPVGAETGPVVVTVRGKAASNQPVFTILLFPSVITSVTPSTGGYNTQVTITGSNFLSTPEANIVTFNGVAGTVTAATSSSLAVKVPARAGSGSVMVNGVAAGIDFKYVPDVFVAGYVGDAGGYSRATYWKNGVPVTLSGTGQNTSVNDIFVVNDDVYVVGYRHIGAFTVARWWKNGVEMKVSDDARFSLAESIFVSGSDVYITGYEGNAAGKSIARYWKNGNPTDLADDTGASATSVTVNGPDVYIGGHSIRNGNTVGTVWKNGTPTFLTTGFSFVWDIYVLGDDVYTTGSIRNTGPGVGFVSYWKNETAVLLGPGLGSGAGRGIVISGNDVYVAGLEANAKTIQVAKYWKNGAPVGLSDGGYYAAANAIDVLAEDVYVGGFEYNAADVPIAKLWKNGVPIAITDGSYAAVINAIVVR
jgi:uncharacterized protein (TIGR03437 family)